MIKQVKWKNLKKFSFMIIASSLFLFTTSVFPTLTANSQFTERDYAIFGGYDQGTGYNGRYFQPGDTVHIQGNFYGTANSSPQPLNDVLIDVTMNKPNGETVSILENYVPKKAGEFEAKIPIDDTFPIGRYDFSFSAHKEGQTSEPNEHQSPFYVARVKQFVIPAEGKDFTVQTESIEFEITNLVFDKESKSIIMNAKRIPGKYSTAEGLQFGSQIGITIQRPLISPPFFLAVNGQESFLDEYNTKITDDKYSTGIYLHQIEKEGTAVLTGTYVVPEFPVAVIILVASVIAILIITQKWVQNKPMMVP
ncbi:MAG: PEFG-CTERM sorting domain-containing protein [Nitrosopumilaceae archaeon]